jgi:hypothetical protein
MFFPVVIGLIVFAIIGWLTAVIFVFKWVGLGRRVLDAEEQIETSLDILDHQYRKLSSILAIPLTSDDAYARAVVTAIKDAHSAVFLVANRLTRGLQTPEENSQEQDDEDE